VAGIFLLRISLRQRSLFITPIYTDSPILVISTDILYLVEKLFHLDKHLDKAFCFVQSRHFFFYMQSHNLDEIYLFLTEFDTRCTLLCIE